MKSLVMSRVSLLVAGAWFDFDQGGLEFARPFSGFVRNPIDSLARTLPLLWGVSRCWAGGGELEFAGDGDSALVMGEWQRWVVSSCGRGWGGH